MPKTRIQRYLDAFAAIDRLLRDAADEDQGTPFHKVVTKAAGFMPVVAEFDADLREYGELRNALVHQRDDDKPLASPYLNTVRRVEALREKVVRPPLLTEIVAVADVVSIDVKTTIREAARLMYGGDFSQVPVYEDRVLVGVLTSETITRWLGATATGRAANVTELAVAALPFTESTTSWRVVSSESDVYLAIRLFREYSLAGKSLDAILVTPTGDSMERAITIVTVFDMPRLVAAAWPYVKRSELAVF